MGGPLWRANEFDQAETVGSVRALKLHDIHTLLDKMQSKPAGFDVVQLAPAKFFRVNRGSVVGQQDFYSLCRLASFGMPPSLANFQFDGPVRRTLVRMANDVGQRFVHRACDSAGLFRRKPESFGKALDRAAHRTK